ncbi:hypothetical protein vseg_005985 [Gypsophila vaccaria]
MVCEEDCMLIRRDQEIHSRLTTERLARVKQNAHILSQTKTTPTSTRDDDVEVDREQISLTQAQNDPIVLEQIDRWIARVTRVSKAVNEYPSLDLGINDIGLNKIQNIDMNLQKRCFARRWE